MGLVLMVRRKLDLLKWRTILDGLPSRHLIAALAHEIRQDRQAALDKLKRRLKGDYIPEWGLLGNAALKRLADVLAAAAAGSESSADELLQTPSLQQTVCNAVLSLERYGVTFPMRFYAPLMVVWNVTWACNLRCKHCYEDAGPLRERVHPPELTRQEKLRLVDHFWESYVPTLSYSGGEPLMDPDFWEVAGRAAARGFHQSINTNGTLIGPEEARRFRELGFAYLAISLDGPEPALHDDFRGVPGAWERTVEGIRNAVAAGVPTVLSFTMTRHNYRTLPRMFRLAEELGMTKVMVYNFIPTGRGAVNAEMDLTPQMREEALQMMHEYAAQGGSICTTAPQFGRYCMQAGDAGLIPLAHTGPGRAQHLQILAQLIGGCGAGRAYCAVQPDGTVTPCVYMPDVRLENLREKSLLSIWQEMPFLMRLSDRTQLTGHCGECEFRAVCGGCRARAWAYLHDPTGPDPGCVRNLPAWEGVLHAAEAGGTQEKAVSVK